MNKNLKKKKVSKRRRKFLYPIKEKNEWNALKKREKPVTEDSLAPFQKGIQEAAAQQMTKVKRKQLHLRRYSDFNWSLIRCVCVCALSARTHTLERIARD